MRRLLAAIGAASLMTMFAVAPAYADPAICGTADTPPCAPPAPFTLTPEQSCAVIAWRTLVPCNWWGAQVPQGTPGSVG